MNSLKTYLCSFDLLKVAKKFGIRLLCPRGYFARIILIFQSNCKIFLVIIQFEVQILISFFQGFDDCFQLFLKNEIFLILIFIG